LAASVLLTGDGHSTTLEHLFGIVNPYLGLRVVSVCERWPLGNPVCRYRRGSVQLWL